MVKRPNRILTPIQERFCVEYLRAKDATKAAIAAGYTKQSANKTAMQLLRRPYIAKKIKELRDANQERTNITIDMVLIELWHIANSDPADAFDERGKLKSIHEMPPHLRKTIKSIQSYEDYTEGVEVGEIQKLQFWDKTKALEMLCKHLGMFIDINLNKNINVNVNAEPESEALQTLKQTFSKAVEEIKQIKDVKPITIKKE